MKKFFEKLNFNCQCCTGNQHGGNPVGRGYSSPAIEVIDLHYEGVICMSGNGTIDPAAAEEDDWLLGF